ASRFLSRVDLSTYPDLFALADVLSDVDAIERGNCAAKAAVDIALHDWVGKRLGRSFCRIWGLDPATCPVTSFTSAWIQRRSSV
ncbi:MAG TPA: hypothetical protein VEO56_14070, partial [Bacteroidota bacterium]|nr:hypothetical protein [Bacteroidota bacterium]